MIALKKYIQDHDRLYKLCKLGENQNEFFIYCTFYDLRMFTFSKKLNFFKIYIYIEISYIEISCLKLGKGTNWFT